MSIHNYIGCFVLWLPLHVLLALAVRKACGRRSWKAHAKTQGGLLAVFVVLVTWMETAAKLILHTQS